MAAGAVSPGLRSAASGWERATGARIAYARDLVDRHVRETDAGDVADLSNVDERLDHVVRLGVEPEAPAWAVELRLGDGGDELVLVLRVAVHGLDRVHDDLGSVINL